jgi:hypothetical protein
MEKMAEIIFNVLVRRVNALKKSLGGMEYNAGS